jgi:hypothetical protein
MHATRPLLQQTELPALRRRIEQQNDAITNRVKQ